MRTVFLFLLLVNLAFFAYGWTVLEHPPAHPVAALELQREKIKLIRLEPEPAAPSGKPAASRTAAVPVCVEWGAVAGPEIPRADAVIATLDVPASSVQRTVLDAGAHWVYVPPARSAPQLERTLAELTALGISDYYVVQDAPWRNAVSLGIFKSEEAAKSFLDAVQARGFKSAVAGRRENLLKQIAYFLREPSEATIAKLAELQPSFPGTHIRARPCPESAR